MVNNGALAGLEVAQMGRGLTGVPAPWQGVSRPEAAAAVQNTAVLSKLLSG